MKKRAARKKTPRGQKPPKKRRTVSHPKVSRKIISPRRAVLSHSRVQKGKQPVGSTKKPKKAAAHHVKQAGKKSTKPVTQPITKSQVPIKYDLNVVSVLQEIQFKYGYLPVQELEKLAKENGIPGVNIYGVATFYNQFKLRAPAKFILSVCRGTACHVKNSDTLLVYAEKLLGIKAGESTPDMKITLEVVRCIGACAKAPAVMVNDMVYGNVTNEKLKEIIDSLK